MILHIMIRQDLQIAKDKDLSSLGTSKGIVPTDKIHLFAVTPLTIHTNSFSKWREIREIYWGRLQEMATKNVVISHNLTSGKVFK